MVKRAKGKRKTNPQNLMCSSLCWRASLGPSLSQLEMDSYRLPTLKWALGPREPPHWATRGSLCASRIPTSCLRVTVYGGLQAPDLPWDLAEAKLLVCPLLSPVFSVCVPWAGSSWRHFTALSVAGPTLADKTEAVLSSVDIVAEQKQL